MGRITVFTTDNDLNSHRLIQGLKHRELPYTEISLQRHPSRLSDVKKLTAGSEALPQCFFNTRRVGGVDETLSELRRWDNDTKYASPKAKYEAEIGSVLDPVDKKLSVPEDLANAGFSVRDAPEIALPGLSRAAATFSLPDGTNATVVDITDKIKNSIPLKSLTYKGTLYKKSFTGETAVKIVQDSLKLQEDEAMGFCESLLDAKIIHHVSDKKEFKKCKKELYRLHCDMEANVLNSLRLWTEKVKVDGNELLENLDSLLAKVEAKSTYGASYKVDYKDAAVDPGFLLFEDAVCELQQFDMTQLRSEEEKIAFALNLYSLMLRYAFIKIGISQTESQHLKFLKGTKFNVGGLIFSFQEWIDGVLRGNNKSSCSPKVPFNLVDRRRKFALAKLDYRIHFALNCGAKVGSPYSSPFPYFVPQNIDEQLDIAGRVFCSDDSNVAIDTKSRQVRLSKIFGWYKSDFATDDKKLIGILHNYVVGVKKAEMDRTVSRGIKSVEFIDIDWTRCASNCEPFDTERLVSNVKGFKALAQRLIPPKTPFNESARLDTLKSLNILDTLPEERFDRLAKKVGDELDFPVVLIALMDKDTNRFKSSVFNCPLPMPAPTDGPRDVSFCGHCINGASNQIFCVENLLEDDRFADNPYVVGLGVKFYAGIPITFPSVNDGSPVNIGTVCVFGFESRRFIEEDRKILTKYAAEVKRELLRKDIMTMTGSSRMLDINSASMVKSSAIESIASTASNEISEFSDTGEAIDA